mgnify:CR=1 FL=1|tara:strand:- start:243 stop:734 length:492 start_codon:yes stop_codon:yes gene_type:complete
MIVTCPNCNKKFNIDSTLIPETGRLLQCSSCSHKWYYTIQKNDIEIHEAVTMPEKVQKIPIKSDKKISSSPSLTINNKNQKKNINGKTNNKLDIKNENTSKKIPLGRILNNLIIIIITFVAIILILDTFKNNISNYLPILIPFLDNLYLSFFDLSSFVKDLFN